MWISPIITRELRVALRQREAQRSRLWVAAGAVGLSALFIFLGCLGFSEWGQSLHHYLYYVALYCGVIRPAQACVGLFSEERRDQTLELLYMTGMSSTELIAGKILAGLILASYDLMALMPLMALPYLGGGMTVHLFSGTMLSLPLLLLLSVGFASLASVLTSEDGAAFLLTAAFLALICLAIPLPYALGKTLTSAAPFSPRWLSLSPLWVPWLVLERFTPGQSAEFWTAAAMTLLWALFALALAAILMRRRWRALREPKPTQLRRAWQTLLHGSPQWRGRLRARCLDAAPFQWLVQQDHRSVCLAWSCLCGIGALWLLGFCVWPRQWPTPINGYLTAWILLLLLSILRVYCAAKRLGEDRHSGMLELLLTTPQTNSQIIDGQCDAIEAQFKPVRRACLGLFCLFALLGFLTRAWTWQGVVTYLLVWLVLGCWSQSAGRGSTQQAMWLALNTGRPGYAVWRATNSGGGGSWFWTLYNLHMCVRSWGRSSMQFPCGTPLEMIIVAVVVLVILLIGASYEQTKDPQNLRAKLLRWLRIVAQEPVPERSDPRLKKWKRPFDPLTPSSNSLRLGGGFGTTMDQF